MGSNTRFVWTGEIDREIDGALRAGSVSPPIQSPRVRPWIFVARSRSRHSRFPQTTRGVERQPKLSWGDSIG